MSYLMEMQRYCINCFCKRSNEILLMNEGISFSDIPSLLISNLFLCYFRQPAGKGIEMIGQGAYMAEEVG